MMLKTSDVIALVAAVVAGLSLAISIYAIGSTERIATSGFQSAQKVKLDTATLLAALRSTMVKAALYSQQDPKLRDDPNYPHYIDIRPERASIQGFLNSSTAIAYYLFVAQKSAEARKAGKSREDWRTFFLQLEDLLSRSNTYSAGILAARLETMFEIVSDQDIDDMSDGLEDLPGSVRKIIQERKHDAVIEAMVELGAKPKSESTFPDFVTYLRAQGIKDPDVDLFWSVISGDKTIAQDALNRGAKLNVTETELISRYHDLWNKFNEEPRTVQPPSETPR